MPKLSPIEITVHNPTDSTIRYNAKFACSVDSKGTFTVPVDDDVFASIEALVKNKPGCGVDARSDYNARVNKMTYRLTADNRNDLVAVIKMFAQSMVEADLETELRIFYTLGLHAHYYKGEDGKVYANGRGVKNYEKDKGQWHGKEISFAEDCAMVGVGARVVVVNKLTPGDGQASYSYKTPTDSQLGTQALKLNQWTHQPFPRAVGGAQSGIRSIPYTEEAASLFNDMIMGLALIADRLQTFFGDAEALPELITQKGILMVSRPFPVGRNGTD